MNSVFSQDYPDLEYIVIDGGSRDSTMDIVAHHAGKLAYCVSEPDRGIYDAFNKGIAAATGDVIGFLNSDDFYSASNVLTKVANVLQNSSVDSCYGDLHYVDPDDTEKIVRAWRSGPYNVKRFYRGWMPPHPTFFAKKKCYDACGCFSLAGGSAADYELMLRFLLRFGISSEYIPEVLVKMRTGGESNSSMFRRIIANRMDLKAWHVNGLKPYPWTILFKPISKISQWLVSTAN